MAIKKNRRAARLQGQKWLTISLSESAPSSIATITALDLDAHSFLTTSEGFEVTNDEDSFGLENVTDVETSTPHSPSSNVSETDNVFDFEEAPVNDSTTLAEQVEMHLGSDNIEVSGKDNNRAP